ncbi:hypothetical protein JHL22_02480 [Advenella sp. WQ 585]|uniref:AtuA-like ferredoxin-fold domain-containing protein n=1 Tax=Advenella mandrilli TaxID=2800330 RepID=A0ABS1E8U8_9BURK|nr:hypothetical protein [Advenella mandrilli]MBK1780079.1 hypothetical protein [Advenella mandrilli]MDY0272135.1 hypothetical protein [Advenella sp.]
MANLIVKLHDIAHARAGDKGNRLNISLIPYDGTHWPALLEQITAEKVHQCFMHRGATHVQRYELHNLKALNFVIDNVLEGGVNSSLNLDKHGKSNSFRLLDLEVTI